MTIVTINAWIDLNEDEDDDQIYGESKGKFISVPHKGLMLGV